MTGAQNMRTRRGKWGRHAYFRRLLKLMLALVLGAILCSVMLTTGLLNAYVMGELRQQDERLARGVIDTLDARVEKINASLFTLSLSAAVTDITGGTHAMGRLAKDYEEFATLSQVVMNASEYVQEVFLYVPGSGRIVQSSSVDAEIYVANHVTGCRGEAVYDFLARLTGCTARRYLRYQPPVEGREELLLQMIPVPLGAPNRGYLVAVLKPALFDSGEAESGSSLFVLQNEEVVACTDGAQGQENLARETLSQGGGWAVRGAQCSLSVVSPDSGLTYVYLSGGASLLRTTRRLTWVALALCGALGALSTVLALSLSRRLYQPVGVLINALIARGRLSERATNSELIGMGQVLDEVLVDNSKMRRMLEEMGPAIDEAAFRNVVYHAGVGEGVKWLAPLTGEKLCVVRVRAGRCAPMDMEALTLSLCGELRALLGARITVRAVRDEGSVCLICSHSLDDSHFRRWFAGQMADFEASTLEKRGLPMCYYVSENASLPAGGEARVELLCRLHGQCRSLLERGWLTGMRSGGLWQEDCGVQPDRSLLLMNLATGQEIMRSLRAGDDSAWQQAQMLIDLNVGDGAGSYAGMRKLLGSLLELVYRVDVETLRSAGVEEYSRTLERLLDTDTLPESVEQLRQIYESVCSCRADAARSCSLRGEDIERYVEAHWRENIGLHEAASAFGLSDGYFSALCRQQLGESIVERINRRRIREACELLEKGLSITEISAAVGYASYKTFARYFKKYTAQTPSGYKESGEEGEQAGEARRLNS